MSGLRTYEDIEMTNNKVDNEKPCISDIPRFYQCFELHMKNGDVLEFAEDYDIPVEKGIVGDFKKGRKKFLEYGDLFYGYIVPFDQISFIVMTKVIRNPDYVE